MLSLGAPQRADSTSGSGSRLPCTFNRATLISSLDFRGLGLILFSIGMRRANDWSAAISAKGSSLRASAPSDEVSQRPSPSSSLQDY